MIEAYKILYEQFKTEYDVEDFHVDWWEPTSNHGILVHMKNGDNIFYKNTSESPEINTSYELDQYGDYTMSDLEYKTAFSKKLQWYMLLREMSQKELSELTGINVSTLSHYMNGRRIPDLRATIRICRALDCSVEELTDLG